MITNEKFAEVLKSLNKEDFDAMQELILNLGEKFEDEAVRDMFTENEMDGISQLLESYSNEVRTAVIVCKFKEVYEDVYKEELCLIKT